MTARRPTTLTVETRDGEEVWRLADVFADLPGDGRLIIRTHGAGREVRTYRGFWRPRVD